MAAQWNTVNRSRRRRWLRVKGITGLRLNRSGKQSAHCRRSIDLLNWDQHLHRIPEEVSMSSNRSLAVLAGFVAGCVGTFTMVLVLGAGNGQAPAETAKVAPQAAKSDGKLRIICFGAHPDDCELNAAGVAAMWSARGHHVKFVSVTNGDIGHWISAGGPLAHRRTEEVKRCAAILGIETEVLDIHDGELLPTLENRKTITRLIREWDADIVLCHRPNDYHPDHRNVGLLVQDAAYMVTVPFFCPDIPFLAKNPVFLYHEDNFMKPNPFTADVAISIDDVVEKKLACVEALESQFYEGGCCSNLTALPKTETEVHARKATVRDAFLRQFAASADRFRTQLSTYYGEVAAKRIAYAEAFEICEYGRQPTREELKALFPF
jgi:LmbE family N-acetylglucosaminyl deacetylase